MHIYHLCTFEQVILFLRYVDYFFSLSDVPDILIKGSDEVTCGGTAHFELEVAQEDLLYWSVTWQKVKGGVTERIDTNNMRYCDSSDSRLVIHPVCKEDKGNYQAVLSRISNGKTIKIISNEIFLQTFGGIKKVIK